MAISRSELLHTLQRLWREDLIHASVRGLAEQRPAFSAQIVATNRQCGVLVWTMLALLIGLVAAPKFTLIGINLTLSLWVLLSTLFKLLLVEREAIGALTDLAHVWQHAATALMGETTWLGELRVRSVRDRFCLLRDAGSVVVVGYRPDPDTRLIFAKVSWRCDPVQRHRQSIAALEMARRQSEAAMRLRRPLLALVPPEAVAA